MTETFIGYSEVNINDDVLPSETGKIITNKYVEFVECKFGSILDQLRMHELLKPKYSPESMSSNISTPISNFNDNSTNLGNYYESL